MDCSKVRRTALQMLLKMTECAGPVVTALTLWLKTDLSVSKSSVERSNGVRTEICS